MKSRVAAGVLGILFGQLGIHNFYLGYVKRGLIQLGATVLFCWTGIVPLAVWGWALYESIQILSDKVVDAEGLPLK